MALKIGWGLGVAITACIVSFALWNACLKVGLARTPLHPREQLPAIHAFGRRVFHRQMVSATPALLLLSVTPQDPAGHHLPWAVLAGWTFFLGMLVLAPCTFCCLRGPSNCTVAWCSKTSAGLARPCGSSFRLG